MSSQTKDRWLKHIDFAILDLIVLEACYALAYYLRKQSTEGLFDGGYKTTFMAIFFLAIMIQVIVPVHRDILKRSFEHEMRCSFEYSSMVVGSVLAVLFFLKIGDMSRGVVLIWWTLSILCMILARLGLKKIVVARVRRKSVISRMLLVLDEHNYQAALDTYKKSGINRYKVDAVLIVPDGAVFDGIDIKKIDIKKVNSSKKLSESLEKVFDSELVLPEEVEGAKIFTNLNDYFEFSKKHAIDEVILSVADVNIENAIAKEFMIAGMTIHVNLERTFTDMSNAYVERFADKMMITSTARPVMPAQLIVKRFFDIFGGIVGCVFTAIIYIFIAPIIKIQSPGPIFFKQERVGINGRRFYMYKFRSMYADAEARKKELMSQNKMNGLMFKMDDDPRITPIGKFIRKTSLDEFPQFFNVLMGDMSLVGTRPPTIDEWNKYEVHHRARLAIKPGITGLWQVSGRSQITDFDQVVELDTRYIRNWGIREDIKILLKTVIVVFKRRGAE